MVGYDRERMSLFTDGAAGVEQLDRVDAVLVAIGRLPNMEGFDAVQSGPGRISIDRWGRTSTHGVWAVGDVTPVAHQTHAANSLGRRIVQRDGAALDPPTRRIATDPQPPSFCDPEVVWVGAAAAERAERWHPRALIHLRVDRAGTDRGLTGGVRHGFVALVAIRLAGRIVTATVVGPHASELLPLLTMAVSRRTSLVRLQRVVHAYPTFAGATGAAAGEFARRTLPHLRPELAAYGRCRVVDQLRRSGSAAGRCARRTWLK